MLTTANILKLFYVIALILHFCKRASLQDFKEIKFTTESNSNFCTTAEGKNGRCEAVSRCLSLKNVSIQTTKHCGFIGNMPIVCCPIISGLLSRIRNTENEVVPPQTDVNNTYECGVRSAYIDSGDTYAPFILRKKRSFKHILADEYFGRHRKTESRLPFGGVIIKEFHGGTKVIQHSWPWMVLLWRPQGPQKSFFCGGTLINKRFVITAAHCALSLEPFFARFGEHNYDVFSDTREDVAVKNVTFHPDYEVNLGYYDLALLELDRDVTFKKEIRPLCLPWGEDMKIPIEDQVVSSAGWGKVEYGLFGTASSTLLEADLTVFNAEVCRSSYSTLPDYNLSFPNGMTADNILCAGDMVDGKDPCQGDSGGPLMMRKDFTSTYLLIGVVSKGVGCGNTKFPSLYAPIMNLRTLQWIKETAF